MACFPLLFYGKEALSRPVKLIALSAIFIEDLRPSGWLGTRPKHIVGSSGESFMVWDSGVFWTQYHLVEFQAQQFLQFCLPAYYLIMMVLLHVTPSVMVGVIWI